MAAVDRARDLPLRALGFRVVHVTSVMPGARRLATAAAFGALMSERRAAVAATRRVAA